MAGWLLQRVSGIFLFYALGVHLWTVHYVNSGQLTWEVITARLQDGALWTVYYLLFIPAVVYHASNGLWGIVLDYNPRPVPRRALLALFWGAGLALLIYGYFGMRPLLGQAGAP
ncbi:MAG: hypothetical protein O7E56_01530 [SAR324 cluster bacterium]|nr:hypothetical protein [SAR324 cluster bacterium]